MAYKYNPPAGRPPQQVAGDILHEFEKWNEQAGKTLVTSWQMPIVTYQLGKSSAPVAEAIVTFKYNGQDRRVAVRAWDTFNVNFVCCYLIINGMRLNEARGLSDSIAEAYGLLTAGPAPRRNPWEVLGLPPIMGPPVIRAQYKELAKKLHPDAKPTGDAAAFKELQEAYEALMGASPE